MGLQEPGEMSSPRPWYEPTWRRLAAVSGVAFATLFAFLSGRVSGGADPALSRAAAVSQPSAPAQQTTPRDSAPSPQDQFGDPDGSGDQGAYDGGGAGNDVAPMTTRQS